MGNICYALSKEQESLLSAGRQADLLSFSTWSHSRFAVETIDNLAVFVVANGKLGFSAAFDLVNEIDEIERLVAIREMTLPKIAWQVKQNPEKWLCTALSSLLRQSGSTGTNYRSKRRHLADLKLIADALAGTTSENRAAMWHKGQRILTAKETPVLAYLISDPALRIHWFSTQPAAHFEAVVPLE